MTSPQRKIFWPACAIGLGVWETASLVSRGRVPFVTDASRGARRRWRRRTELVVVSWLVALGVHLLKEAA